MTTLSRPKVIRIRSTQACVRYCYHVFKFENNKCYRMPAHFGGADFDRELQAHYHDVTSIACRQTTDASQLAGYLPDGFELKAPELSVVYQQCRQVDWMAGAAYNLIWVSVPVRFQGLRDQLEGDFALVIWENKATPILTGRDMGMPKIFSDIEDLHIVEGTYSTRASYEGSTFLELEMHALQPMPEEQVRAFPVEQNAMGWRYVPKIGAPGAEVSQATLFPSRSQTIRAWTGDGTLKWTPLTWQQNPMQWHIIRALAELPSEGLSITMTESKVSLMDSRGRVLS